MINTKLDITIEDAFYLERTQELRLVSNRTFNGERIVFSIKGLTTIDDAQSVLDALGICTVPQMELDAQFIDPGVRGIDV